MGSCVRIAVFAAMDAAWEVSAANVDSVASPYVNIAYHYIFLTLYKKFKISSARIIRRPNSSP